MDLLSATLVGILQGITEWLPISSSGQSMLVLMNFLGLEPENAFSIAIFLHIGTLFAVIVKFRKELMEIVKSLSWDNKLMQVLVISTIYTTVIGIPIYMTLDEHFSSFLGGKITALVGIALIVTGIVLFLSKNRFGDKTVEDATQLDMIMLGIAQGFSILPGISRSGVTVAALLFRKFTQEEALRLSFIVSIPAVIGAVLIGFREGFSPDGPAMVGILAAFVFGYLSIDVLLRISKRIRFDMFCVFFGLLALIFSVSGVDDRVCFEAGKCVDVEIVKAPEKRSLGLSFRETLEEGTGMLFVFDEEALYPFWMKDMNFPIDIIWIGQDLTVKHVERALPPCEPDDCPLYIPHKDALYVLEVNANYTSENSIGLGSNVTALPAMAAN